MAAFDLLLLYINAPLAVIVADVKLGSAASKNATELDVSKVTDCEDNVVPPAVYPVPLTSLEVVYADVVASNDALDVYNAIFIVSPPLPRF